MAMTGNQLRELRKMAGLTQAQLADEVALSRRTVNEAEALGDGIVERRTEVAVTAITLAAKARAILQADAERARLAGEGDDEATYRYAATLLTGNFATDVMVIYNLALTAARAIRRKP